MTWELPYWREPLWLWAMLLPAALWLLAYLQLRRRWSCIADPGLRPWVEETATADRHGAMRLALVPAWLLLCVALAGPRTPRWIPPAAQDKATVVVVLDLSASMAARDARPDRRRYAQKMLGAWTAAMPASLRLGIVVYAGHAHRLLRPTADHALVRHFIEQLDGIALPTLGNALGDALRLAGQALAEAGDSGLQRHVLLISDGDLDTAAQRAAEEAAADVLPLSGARLHVLGVGGPEAVGVPRSPTQPLIIDGERVASRRDAAWLRRLAARVDGTYQSAEATGESSLVEVLDLPALRIGPGDEDLVLWDEWFFIPLLAAVALLMLALRTGKELGMRHASVLALLLAMLPGGCRLGLPDETSGAQARAVLEARDYGKARRLYAGLDGYDGRFGEGVACYRLGDYACAAQAFAQAAWLAPDDVARGRAAFNLGNTHFRLGDYPQASVLFAEAEMLGVSPTLAVLNREFADSLAAAVRQRLVDIAETERRAEWRAAANEMPEVLRDRLAEGIHLSDRSARPPAFVTLSPEDLKVMISRGVERSLDGAASASATTRDWVQSATSQEPQSTAGLFNRLLPMESGLPTTPGEPYRLEGQRPW